MANINIPADRTTSISITLTPLGNETRQNATIVLKPTTVNAGENLYVYVWPGKDGSVYCGSRIYTSSGELIYKLGFRDKLDTCYNPIDANYFTVPTTWESGSYYLQVFDYSELYNRWTKHYFNVTA